MSSETPPGPSAQDRPPEPFTRGRIQWSRPPQPVFRVGPVPRAPTSAFVSQPMRRPSPGVLSGSMIPTAAPATPTPEPLRQPAPEAVVAAAPAEPAFDPFALTPDVPAEPKPAPLETVTAAPIEPTPDPEPASTPREILVEVEEAQPAVTVSPPLSQDAQPAVAPRSVPSVVVTPAIYATVSAAIETVTKKDRWVIVAGVVAVLTIGGFILLATLPAGGVAPVGATAPTPAADGLSVELVDPAGPAETPAVAPIRRVEAAPVRPATRTPTQPVRQAAPVVEAPTPPPVETPATVPQPYIETAPLVVTPDTVSPQPEN